MFSSPQRQKVMMPLIRMTWQGTCVQRRRGKEPLMSPCYDSFSFYSSIQNPKHFSSFYCITCLSGRASDKSEAMIDGASLCRRVPPRPGPRSSFRINYTLRSLPIQRTHGDSEVNSHIRCFATTRPPSPASEVGGSSGHFHREMTQYIIILNS